MKNLSKITLILILCISSTSISAQKWWKSPIKGEGAMTSKDFDVKGFDKVGLHISANLYLTQGSSYSMKVEGQQNIIDNNDDGLRIKQERSVRRSEGLKIYITMPKLEAATC